MWGGDKTYIGPDSLWQFVRGKGWPPPAPDSAAHAAEVYHHDLPGPGEYVELELLSPLRRLDAGATLTTRWTLREWPSDPPRGEAKAAEKLLAP